MAYSDPADKALIRLEVRRFIGRCESNEGLVQRADSLRELARLAATTLPYKIANELDAREAQRRLLMATEDRAKELIVEQVAAFTRAGEDHRVGLKSKMVEDWANLTGPLSHLRTWAKGKLTMAEQSASL